MSIEPLARLERELGHRFANRALLEQAVLHASALPPSGGESYQRLEFLGDRVLGLVIAHQLYERFPDAGEGELARRLNALVRRETCADRARALGIDGALKLGHAEAQSGGRNKAAILADACEAVLAAVYLDGGYEAAKAVIVKVWEPLVEGVDGTKRDPKTALQEHVQARGAGPPEYALVRRSGPDHKPHFMIEVLSEGVVLASGEGGSKREAEQSAAQAALAALSLDE
ncbi:MAG: ribonuclease III [Pseudomonadota bacterium]